MLKQEVLKKITVRGLPKARYYYEDCHKKLISFVCIMQIDLDSRSRPTAESCCFVVIAVEENTSGSE